MNDFVENEHITIWIEDDLLCAVFKKKTIFKINAAKESVALRVNFTKGKTMKAMIYINHIGIISYAAKRFMASPEASEGLEKLAIIANSPITAMIGNLFISFSKTLVPAKMFVNKEAAVKWLNAKH